MMTDSTLILDRLVEGGCPRCGATLDRKPGCGWCTACDVGWSMRSDPEHPEYPLFYIHSFTGYPDWSADDSDASAFGEEYVMERPADESGHVCNCGSLSGAVHENWCRDPTHPDAQSPGDESSGGENTDSGQPTT